MRRHARVVEEPANAALDLVADGADFVDGLAGGVVQGPVEVPPAGKTGQASPQPMVTTTSAAAQTIPSVQGSVNSREMSMPGLLIAALAAGLISLVEDPSQCSRWKAIAAGVLVSHQWHTFQWLSLPPVSSNVTTATTGPLQ